MTPNERVRMVRKHYDLTAERFGERIGLKRNSVSQLETGKNSLTEQTIKLICQEFAISYDWLKNGVEPMKMPAKEADRYNIDRIMTGDNEFVKSVFRGLADLPPEAWEEIEKFVDRYISKKDRP